MDPDDVPIDAWLSESSSDPVAVSHRYDEWARTYNDDLTAWSYQAPAVVADNVVRRRAGAGSVLDVGCGTGLVGRALRERDYAGRLTGVDLSQASLDQAGAAGDYDALERVDLQQPLGFGDDSFDVVVCVGVMTYLPEVEAVWREFARVGRSGALVVVTQREDLWEERDCPAILTRLQDEGVWSPVEVSGPAPYLPVGYGGTPEVGCYYLTAAVS